MMQNSFVGMTAIDLLIIFMAGGTIVFFARNFEKIRAAKAQRGAFSILLGLCIFAVFYLFELVTVIIFPMFMPMAKAMSYMDYLHQNVISVVSAFSMTFIVLGLLHVTRCVFVSNERAQAARAELNQREVDLIVQNVRFNAALDNMSQGLCMFDGAKCLIVANERYGSIYNLSPELLKPGTTLRQILEYRIANGLYAGEDPEEYIQERMAWVTSGKSSSKIQILSDGRAIAITHQPMSSGGWLTTHEDVTDITKTQQVAERQKEELDQILRNVPRAVIKSDRTGVIRIFNPAAEQTFGYNAAEMIGRNVSLLMPEKDRHHHDDYLRSYLETGVSKFIEVGPRRLTGRHKDGTEFPMELALGVVGQGKDTGFIGVAKDITEELKVETRLIEHRDSLQKDVDLATVELKAKAKKLKLALKKEQELNKLQREFVTMASHEFRTPLSIIDGSAQFLERKGENVTPDYVLSRTRKIREAVQRMTRLMESTLTAARMEEGKINIEIGECDLRYYILEVLTNQIELSPGHNITCDLKELPDRIQGDSGALNQIFSNLMSNAVKYSPDAKDIHVRGWREDDMAAIEVRDRGLGIDRQDIPKLFGRFFRAKTSTGIAGTGIGLNLVKTLVEGHGGSVEVESKKDEGSTFTIRLPIAGPDLSEQTDTKAA